jgi:hypothetical protein
MIRFRLWLTLFALGLPFLAGCCCGSHPWAYKPCCPPAPCCGGTASSGYFGGPLYTSAPITGSAYPPLMEGKPGCAGCGVTGLPTSNGLDLGMLGTPGTSMPIISGGPRGGTIFPPITTSPEGTLPAPMSVEPPLGQMPPLSPIPRLTPTPTVPPAQPTPADPVYRGRSG